MVHRPRLRTLKTLASFALMVALTPADAAEATRAKATFFAGDAAAPELADDYLRTHPGEGIEILTFSESGKDPTEIFHALGPMARSRAGVCRFTATQIFPHRADDGTIAWNSTPLNPREHAEPAYTMAAVAGNSCPKEDDDNYASVEGGISDPEFVAVTKFWKEISGSADKFDQASVYLSLIVSQRAADQFAAFRAALFDSKGAPPPQLQAVFRGGLDAYDLAFGMAANSSNYFLSISKSSAGFEVLNFQTQY
jgi:hypothetical protein